MSLPPGRRKGDEVRRRRAKSRSRKTKANTPWESRSESGRNLRKMDSRGMLLRAESHPAPSGGESRNCKKRSYWHQRCFIQGHIRGRYRGSQSNKQEIKRKQTAC